MFLITDVVEEKYKNKSEELIKFEGRVGKWLSGANDRGGGRKARKQN